VLLGVEEEVWAELKGGYRSRFDPRPTIARLDSDEHAAAWEELWTELYHQSDVGPASYAAVPLIVERLARLRDANEQAYAIVGAIELARTLPQNPPVPDWLRDPYFGALGRLAELALSDLRDANTEEQVGSMMGVVALSKGDRPRARLLLQFSRDELEEMIAEYRDG
jgi:hypothetical protein